MRIFFGAIFLTTFFGIYQCVGNNVGLKKETLPSVMYSNNIVGGSFGYYLSRFWSDQANAIEEMLIKTFNCAKMTADELFFKAEPAKCGAGEWLQDLWAIVRYNDLVAMDLDMTRTCKFMDDQINYITKPDKNLNDEPLKKMVKTNKGVSQKAINHLIQLNQILNDETIRDLRQIVSFGKQFNLPLAKSVFNVYGSQTDSPRVGSDRDTSYYGILHKYENRLKSLDGNQQKKLNSLVKSTKPKIATIYNKIHDISLNSNDNLKKFHTVTFEIFLAMKQMAEEKNVAESVKTIHESIAVCKKYMRLPYLKKTIDTNIDNLKPLMDELVAAQKNLSHDIEEILKVEPKKSALSYLRLKK